MPTHDSPGSGGSAPEPLQLFVLDDCQVFGARLGAALGVEPVSLEHRLFEDGEFKLRPLEEVRGRDAFVVQRLSGAGDLSVNDRLVRLLFFIATLRDQGVARCTAVVPYLPYARKDQRTKPRDPLSLRYLAQLFEAVGTDRIMVMDVHNVAAFENAFRCNTVHVEARDAFAGYIRERVGERPLVVVSPDSGGVKRANAMRLALREATGCDPASAFLEKYRTEGVVSGEALVGSVDGCVAVIVDDLIAGGTTMRRAVRTVMQHGATGAIAVATHGVFADEAPALLDEPGLETVLVTNSVASPLLASGHARLQVLPVEPMLAAAISSLQG
ncbi:MAG: ribose-phosphate pyrophosphokinase [Ectothiorhodospiraceae bacterium]|nr:ribose-phosphate pyrophosphokinase [Ectothiorhodospiraceae bacterium]MCH8503965.1 ribose-phosphate diphosphokinase [Ectothiorhodospiraceae bacterium]